MKSLTKKTVEFTAMNHKLISGVVMKLLISEADLGVKKRQNDILLFISQIVYVYLRLFFYFIQIYRKI